MTPTAATRSNYLKCGGAAGEILSNQLFTYLTCPLPPAPSPQAENFAKELEPKKAELKDLAVSMEKQENELVGVCGEGGAVGWREWVGMGPRMDGLVATW
jgi:hypothetical protein